MKEQSRNVPDQLRTWAKQVGLLPGGQDGFGVYRRADVAGAAALLAAVAVVALILTWAPGTLPLPVPILGAILAAVYLQERCPGWSVWLRLGGVAITFLVLAYLTTFGLALAMSLGVAYYLHRRRPRARSGLICLGEWDDNDGLRIPFMVSADDMDSLVEQIEEKLTDLAEVDPDTPVMVAVDPDESDEESERFAEFATEIDPDDELPLTVELAVDGNPNGSAHVVIARLPEDK